MATALNPVDWKMQKYGIFQESHPALFGEDVAGVVEQVGEGVTAFKKGDRVSVPVSQVAGSETHLCSKFP
jgi:NADPH:quinone reductase-like Zn-dependent oxidoreductase